MPRYRSRRRSSFRPITKTYKKVLTFAPAAHAAATKIDFPLVTGVDSLAAGQTSVTDSTVPTGSVVSYIEINYSFLNLIAPGSGVFMSLSIQQLLTGQSSLDPRVVGGDPQRNQVFHQEVIAMGSNQNGNRVIRFKIPKNFQRVRDGQRWFFTVIASGVFSDNLQVIYKIKS